MFIHNIRYGFATNSSSAHSIVLFNEKVFALDDCNDDAEFGWENFTCSSETSKRQYIGQLVKDIMMDLYNLPSDQAVILASSWCGVAVNPNGYIDHQSVFSLPVELSFGAYKLNKKFFDDFLKYILKDNVAILGGNDNGDCKHHLIYNPNVTVVKPHRYYEDSKYALNLLSTYNKYFRARYDATGNFWTLFDSINGTKVRLSFNGSFNADKSEAPELVDLKITDYCNKGCRYCYQGSTPKGEHATLQNIQRIAYSLKELGVFEVALGGGEPTQHPDLEHIIEFFTYHGIIVNLTTRNEDWVVNNISKLKGKIGAIGLSVDSSDRLIERFSKLKVADPDLNFAGPNSLKVTAQVVVGSCSQYELENILTICYTFNINVLLLGWKNTHRGKNGPDYEINLPHILNKFYRNKQWRGPSISFDTVLVNTYFAWLQKHSKEYYFTTTEGAHSMYIDAVKQTIHCSSYDESEGVSIQNTGNDQTGIIKNFFSTIGK